MTNLLSKLGIDTIVISFEELWNLEDFIVSEFSTSNMKILREGNKQWMLNLLDNGWRSTPIADAE